MPVNRLNSMVDQVLICLAKMPAAKKSTPGQGRGMCCGENQVFLVVY